ncbi:hypothetical protein [Tenacibaculum phage Larrie]|nr:hypothetical protein [Tenacibaculum phage Larrie]
MKELFIIFNDAHIKNGNEDQVYRSCVHLVKYASDNEIKDVVFAGDMFDSRSQQRLKQLFTLHKILKLFKDYGLTLHLFAGNHDKTLYTDYESFLDIFQFHPNVEFYDRLTSIKIKGVGVDFLPFFDDSMLVPMLKEAEGNDILVSHFEMYGSSNMGNVSKKESITKETLSKWKKTFLGHYHDTHDITKDITHLPSLRQNYYKEDSNKGFSVVYEDLSYEIIKGDFVEFKTIPLHLDSMSKDDVLEAIKANKKEDLKIRFELLGEESVLRSFSTSVFTDNGVDFIKKFEKIYDKDVDTEKPKVVEKYTKETVLNSFEEFCTKKNLNINEGLEILTKFLNNK